MALWSGFARQPSISPSIPLGKTLQKYPQFQWLIPTLTQICRNLPIPSDWYRFLLHHTNSHSKNNTQNSAVLFSPFIFLPKSRAGSRYRREIPDSTLVTTIDMIASDANKLACLPRQENVCFKETNFFSCRYRTLPGLTASYVILPIITSYSSFIQFIMEN